MAKAKPIQRLSVIVPVNPFAKSILKDKHCLSAFDVDDLMELWPGKPHSPHRNPEKVKAIQRSLDWKRVAHIAAYLLQKEITDAPTKLNKYFEEFYEPVQNEPGREWPPKINKVIGFQPSEVPTFSNVLIHVNGAKLENIKIKKEEDDTSQDDASNGESDIINNNTQAGDLVFNKKDPNLFFSVIDGQHRINGAYFALCILREEDPNAKWQIPAEIFLDLDDRNSYSKQAQIFIDVNFNQKKVDRSLVADLYPTARAFRETMGNIERAQDLGRKLMLEKGPLVGMIQIPGIKYGVKDVIALSTLNGAIENVLDIMAKSGISNLEMQADFLAQCLTAWLEASGRFETKSRKKEVELDPQNVVYQGRILVSVIALIPALIWKLKKERIKLLSEDALTTLTKWLKDVAKRANMLQENVFIDKKKFRVRGYLGSGGIGRFRDSFWAVMVGNNRISQKTKTEKITLLAKKNRDLILSELENM